MENLSPEQRESLWRRKLSAAERAELRSQPELELEARLTEFLGQMPHAPVPSNFTARVLDAIDREEAELARTERLGSARWNWRALWPRFAMITGVLLFTGLGLQHHETVRQRAEMVKSLSLVASTQTVPSVDVLENLEAIQRMSQPAHADTELLAALQ